MNAREDPSASRPEGGSDASDRAAAGAGPQGGGDRPRAAPEIVWFRQGAEEMVVDVSGTDDPESHLAAARYRRLAELRERFGRPLWLTLVSTVFAGAYRRAGMTGEEVGELLFAERPDRTAVCLSVRRNPNMRLMRALGGTGGAIHRAGGLHCAFFHFRHGTYRDWDRTLLLSAGTDGHRLAPGGPGSRLGDVLADAPVSLAEMTVADVRSDDRMHHVEIEGYWESLLPMPDAVADELGFRRQDHLGDLCWLDDLRSPTA